MQPREEYLGQSPVDLIYKEEKELEFLLSSINLDNEMEMDTLISELSDGQKDSYIYETTIERQLYRYVGEMQVDNYDSTPLKHTLEDPNL